MELEAEEDSKSFLHIKVNRGRNPETNTNHRTDKGRNYIKITMKSCVVVTLLCFSV